jgi:hypothetical protein
MSLATDILAWNDQLRSQFTNFFTTAQEIVDYMMPDHRAITTETTPGERKDERIFDSTAPNSLFLVSSFLVGALFNEAMAWFDIKHRMEELNTDADVSEYLQACRKVQFASLRQSNFYATPIELIQDWLAFGNLCVLQERMQPNPRMTGKLVFSPLGFGSYVFFEGQDKRPEGLIHEVDWNAKDCYDKWGDKCSRRIQEAAEKKPFMQIRLVHSIMPRKLVSYKRLATPKEMPYSSCWFEKDNKRGPALEESGYPEKPFAIARYNVIAGEVMGRGLGGLALPHTKTLNGIIARGFMELDRALDPPLETKMGNIIGDYSHRPGAKNIMRDIGQTRISQAAMEMRSRNATYEWNVNDLRQQIREIFFVEHIRQLIGVEASPVKEQTAYEYSKRLELVHMIMAPTGGRLQTEALRDIIDANFSINYRIGAFPETPQVLVEAAAQSEAGKQIDVSYEGPLAKSQRQEELGTMREYMGDVANAAQLDPGAVDIPNIDKILRKTAEIRGIQHLLNDEKQTGEIRKLKGQIQQLQAQLAAATQMSEIAKNAAPMVTAMQNGKQNGAGSTQTA